MTKYIFLPGGERKQDLTIPKEKKTEARFSSVEDRRQLLEDFEDYDVYFPGEIQFEHELFLRQGVYRWFETAGNHDVCVVDTSSITDEDALLRHSGALVFEQFHPGVIHFLKNLASVSNTSLHVILVRR